MPLSQTHALQQTQPQLPPQLPPQQQPQPQPQPRLQEVNANITTHPTSRPIVQSEAVGVRHISSDIISYTKLLVQLLDSLLPHINPAAPIIANRLTAADHTLVDTTCLQTALQALSHFSSALVDMLVHKPMFERACYIQYFLQVLEFSTSGMNNFWSKAQDLDTNFKLYQQILNIQDQLIQNVPELSSFVPHLHENALKSDTLSSVLQKQLVEMGNAAPCFVILDQMQIYLSELGMTLPALVALLDVKNFKSEGFSLPPVLLRQLVLFCSPRFYNTCKLWTQQLHYTSFSPPHMPIIPPHMLLPPQMPVIPPLLHGQSLVPPVAQPSSFMHTSYSEFNQSPFVDTEFTKT